MEQLIRESIPPIVDGRIRQAIEFRNYDLIAPNGLVIREHLWEQTVQPGWTIRQSLWPSTTAANDDDDERPREADDGAQPSPNSRNPRQPQTRQIREESPRPDDRGPVQAPPQQQTATTPRPQSPVVAVAPQRRRSPSPRRRRTEQRVSPFMRWISGGNVKPGGNRRRPPN